MGSGLLVVGFRFQVTGCWLLVSGCEGFELQVAGFWFAVAGLTNAGY